MSTYSNEANAAALNGFTDALNAGFFSLMNSVGAELARPSFGNPAFNQGTIASPSVALATAITADTSVTPGVIVEYRLLLQDSSVYSSGTVGIGPGFDLSMASVTIPPAAASVSVASLALSLQLG